MSKPYILGIDALFFLLNIYSINIKFQALAFFFYKITKHRYELILNELTTIHCNILYIQHVYTHHNCSKNYI